MSITRVARLAGVSSSTVSRVINNHPRVAPDTAKAVRSAMEKLAYAPSDRRPGPKPLRLRRPAITSVKLLALGGTRGTVTPGFTELLNGISQAAAKLSVRVSYAHVLDRAAIADQLRGERVDGLLLHGQMPDKEACAEMSRYPTVWLMGNRSRPSWGDQVMPDAYAIGELAAKELVHRGHRRLAFLNLEADFWPLALYEHAFTHAARHLGAEVASVTYERPKVSDYWQPHGPEAVDEIVSRLLALDPAPTAVFVADDIQVAHVQPALQRRGATIGKRGLDVVSCNNEQPYLASLSPRPTSIDIRLAAIGRRAVEQFLWRLEHPNVPERFVISIEPRMPPA